MLLPVDVALMVEMRRRAVAFAAEKNFSFLNRGDGGFSKASFLLSEKTGDSVDKILNDAEKRARKNRGI